MGRGVCFLLVMIVGSFLGGVVNAIVVILPATASLRVFPCKIVFVSIKKMN